MTDNLFWLAINIYHEARGESVDGQIAVAHVCMNRAVKRKQSVKDVVLAPWQFSWHNNGAYPVIRDYSSLETCFNSARTAIDQRLEGITLEGADHYFADYITPPKWSVGMKLIDKIGKHLFYKE